MICKCPMRNLLALILVFTCVSAKGENRREKKLLANRANDVPVAVCGMPLGNLVLIEGVRVEGFKTGIQTLRIDKINGKALASPTTIWVDNAELPKEVRCILRGYEIIQMIGKPPAYAQFAKLKHLPPPPEPQAAWQVFHTFVVLEVVQPKSLRIRKTGT